MKPVLCHLCGSTTLNEHKDYRRLKRVTSDCKPWDAGGELCTCETCGCTQAICDDVWQRSVQSIYRNYTIYYQGCGEEQKIFDPITARMVPRSEWLLECIGRHVQLPENGRALDFGCGNGRFLKALGLAYPQWRLSGVEFDEKYRAIVESLPGVEKLYADPLSTLPVNFDLISLIHVLEHIENPIPFLKEIQSKLSVEGLLFVELPSYKSNPFELLIVDHATHYSLESIQWTLGQAGFSTLVSSSKWVSKEMSILGCAADKAALSSPSNSPGSVEAAISWIQHVAIEARRARNNANTFGIFGTSIAGTWLATELGDAPDFFVDEDQNRIGHTHMGIPICAPSDVPDASVVFVAQPACISAQIAARLERNTVTYHYTMSQYSEV